MPDALSKTVPIWTCVLNRLLFPEDDSAGELRTPGHVVSRSEHERIEERVLQCVQEARSLELDLGGMRARLGGKPMLLVWITPDSSLPRHAPERADRNLVVLCTASSRLSSNGALEAAYVQGAADDSESWALGLDAATFWVFRERLLSTAEDELPDVIRQVVSQVRDQQAGIRVPVLVRPTSNIWIGDNTTTKDRLEEFDLVVSCSEEPAGETAIRFKDLYLNLACSSGKVGSRQLRAQLPRLAQLRKAMTPTSKLLVTCHSGRDLSVGVALAIICLFYDDNGMFAADDINSTLAKPLIKHRLSWIMVSMPDATPSRATLQSVNAFLLG